MYKCIECKQKLFNSPYYITKQGKICECCYEGKGES